MKMMEVVKIGEARGSTDSAFGDGRGWASPNAEYRDWKLQVRRTSGRVRCGLKEELHWPDEALYHVLGGMRQMRRRDQRPQPS